MRLIAVDQTLQYVLSIETLQEKSSYPGYVER